MIASMEELPFRAHRDMVVRMSKQFSDHKKGIPEWLKNANDSYYRHESNGKDCSKLPIIINFSKREVSCIDFGGADGEVIKDKGLNYGDPTAANQGIRGNNKVEGGHGNGGKYYGLAQFEKCELVTYYRRKFSMFTITETKDYQNDLNRELNSEDAISYLNTRDWNIWKRRPELWDMLNEGFFCWRGVNPKDTKKITVKPSFQKLINAITFNKQAVNTIREREVIILRDGKVMYDGLDLPEIDIDPKYNNGWSFNLPNEIHEHRFNKHLQSVLNINVSSKPLTSDLTGSNCMDISTGNQVIASYSMSNLTSNKGIAKSLYVTINCPELKEYGCVDNDRIHLIDNELGNEFIDWCKKKINEVIDEIEELEKKETNKKEFKKISNFLNEIMDAVSDLLEEEDLIKLEQAKKTGRIEDVEMPTGGLGGFGKILNKIKKKGGGKRTGTPEKKETEVQEKKGKNKLRILLSNTDEDPLNEGKTFDLTPRNNILEQRAEDVEYGIWWLNTQKKYLINFRERTARTTPFYLFIIKEVIFSQRSRKNFSSKTYDPDEVESLNLDLIDLIFSKVADKLDLDISDAADNASERVRRYILTVDSFYVKEIAEKLNLPDTQVHVILHNNKDLVDENFILEKENGANHYIKKI